MESVERMVGIQGETLVGWREEGPLIVGFKAGLNSIKYIGANLH